MDKGVKGNHFTPANSVLCGCRFIRCSSAIHIL